MRSAVLKRVIQWSTLALLSAAVTGCVIPQLIGGMAASAERQGSSTIDAEYFGLEDKSYAVVVVADRLIQSEFPALTSRITQRVDAMLYQNAGASGHAPPARLLGYLYDHPGWVALPRGQLAEEIGVERLVVIEILEYRLGEPGNRYTWNGVASANVEVYETEYAFPDDPAFERLVRVRFPDSDGILREQISEAGVNTALSNRLCDRAAWLFYSHEEPNAITY